MTFAAIGDFMPDFEKKIFICKKHGEYESIWNGIAKRWSSCRDCRLEADRQVERQKELKRLADLELKEQEKVWGEAAIPLLYQNENKSFAKYKVQYEKQRKHYLKLKEFVNNIQSSIKNGESFAFMGNTDTGKTHLAVAIAQEALAQDLDARYTTFGKVMLELRDTFNGNSFDTELAIVKKYLSVKLLIIDEIPAEITKDYKLEMFFEIVNQRYQNVKSTIYITNHVEGFLKTDDRIWRRISRENSTALKFDWPGFNK